MVPMLFISVKAERASFVGGWRLFFRPACGRGLGHNTFPSLCPGEDHGGKSSRRKQHSTRKKKKKKKRGSDSSSDSDSELALKQEAFEEGRSLAVALPDIIPKQVKLQSPSF